MDELTSTLAERIKHTLHVTRRAWNDDQLAAHLGVNHRQAVNQACRRLATAGELRRYVGADGKLVNEAIDLQDAVLVAPAASAKPAERRLELKQSAGHSGEQRAAEKLIVAYAGRVLGVELKPQRIETLTGARVEVDGADQGRTVLVEAWAHQGPPKVAQKHKVLADALKLHWIASTLPGSPRLVLCFSDDDAARPFREGRSWAAAAFRDLHIEVLVAELPDDVRAGIVAAQRRQFR